MVQAQTVRKSKSKGKNSLAAAPQHRGSSTSKAMGGGGDSAAGGGVTSSSRQAGLLGSAPLAAGTGAGKCQCTCACGWEHFSPDPLRVAARVREVVQEVGVESLVRRLQDGGFDEALAQRVVLEYTCVRGQGGSLDDLLQWCRKTAVKAKLSRAASPAELHRYMGVPFAVEEVLRRLPDAPVGVVEVAAVHMLGRVDATEQLVKSQRALLQEVATRAAIGQHTQRDDELGPQLGEHPCSMMTYAPPTPRLFPSPCASPAATDDETDELDGRLPAAGMAGGSGPQAGVTEQGATPDEAVLEAGRIQWKGAAPKVPRGGDRPPQRAPGSDSGAGGGGSAGSGQGEEGRSEQAGGDAGRGEAGEVSEEVRLLREEVARLRANETWAKCRIEQLVKKACEQEKPVLEENKQLKEQLDKARRSAAVSSEAAREAGASIAKLERGNEALAERLRAVEDEVQSVYAELNAAQVREAEVKASLGEVQQQSRKERRRAASVDAQRQAMAEAKAELLSKLEAEQKRSAALEQERARLEKLLSERMKRLEDAEAVLEAEQAALARYQRRVEASEREVRQRQQALKTELEAVEQSRAQVEAVLSQAEQMRDQAGKDAKAAAKQQRDAERRVKEAEEQVGKARAQEAKWKQEVCVERQARRALQEEFGALRGVEEEAHALRAELLKQQAQATRHTTATWPGMQVGPQTGDAALLAQQPLHQRLGSTMPQVMASDAHAAGMVASPFAAGPGGGQSAREGGEVPQLGLGLLNATSSVLGLAPAGEHEPADWGSKEPSAGLGLGLCGHHAHHPNHAQRTHPTHAATAPPPPAPPAVAGQPHGQGGDGLVWGGARSGSVWAGSLGGMHADFGHQPHQTGLETLEQGTQFSDAQMGDIAAPYGPPQIPAWPREQRMDASDIGHVGPRHMPALELQAHPAENGQLPPHVVRAGVSGEVRWGGDIGQGSGEGQHGSSSIGVGGHSPMGLGLGLRHSYGGAPTLGLEAAAESSGLGLAAQWGSGHIGGVGSAATGVGRKDLQSPDLMHQIQKIWDGNAPGVGTESSGQRLPAINSSVMQLPQGSVAGLLERGAFGKLGEGLAQGNGEATF